MIIRVTNALIAPELLDPEEFGEFRVDAVGIDDVAVASSLTGSGVGDVIEGHAFIVPDALRRLAGPAVDEHWESGFSAMLAFARSKGWVDDSGRIRAHLERT